MVKHSADDILKYLSFPERGFGNLHELSSPFSGKNKKNISLSSAEFAQRVLKVKVLITTRADDILIFSRVFFRTN